MNDKPAKVEMITLKQLCAELKVGPTRSARETSARTTRRRILSWQSHISQGTHGNGRRIRLL